MSTQSGEGVIQRAYNRVRPYLPRKIGVYAGVPVRSEAILDSEDWYPDYKKGLIDAIHEYVDAGDTVSLIGGGRGVSTVHCVRAGADQVVSYEAAEEMLTTAQDTVRMEEVSDQVDWRHALVGEAIEIYGNAEGADVVHPSNVADADVLVMDCEGAEKSILAEMGEYPATTIVETHPERGVPTEVTEQLLDDAGYAVESYPFQPDHHEPDKRVLVGVSR